MLKEEEELLVEAKGTKKEVMGAYLEAKKLESW